MSVAEVQVSPRGGPVSVRVAERRAGEGIVSVVWRFDEGSRREGVVGEISREVAEIPLGAPGTVDGAGFMIDGFVVPLPGRAAVPYQVIVTVLQDGRRVHEAVPAEGGSGTLGPMEIRFRYPFILRVRRPGGARGHRPSVPDHPQP